MEGRRLLVRPVPGRQLHDSLAELVRIVAALTSKSPPQPKTARIVRSAPSLVLDDPGFRIGFGLKPKHRLSDAVTAHDLNIEAALVGPRGDGVCGHAANMATVEQS